MVFLRRKPPDVTQQNFPLRHAQRSTQAGAAHGVGGKAGSVDAVVYHGERVAPEQHLAGFLAAGKAVGQPGAETAAHQLVQRADKVRLIRGVVAVPCPHGDARFFGGGVVEHTKAAVMPVQDAPFGVGGKELMQIAQVAGEVIVLPDGGFVDAPAKAGDLVVKKARFIVMIQKVELHLVPVNGAVNVHDEGFHAAGVHGGHNL